MPLRQALDRLGRLLGTSVTSVEVVRRGYTPALRAIATLQDGHRVFIKVATDDPTAAWLHSEHRIYTALEAPFLPKFRAFDAPDGEPPMLVLEDLGAARWPPPWLPGDVDEVRATLTQVAESRLPFDPPALEPAGFRGWALVAEDPGPFLALGLVSAEWLARCLPTLLAAADAAPLAGEDLLHLDVRSDNLCLAPRGPVLVDWNHVRRGNGLVDVACWLPSLAAEGGPAPADVLPNQPELAAWITGFFAARAGLPPVPRAPGVRPIQRVQLAHALPWAVLALGLPAVR